MEFDNGQKPKIKSLYQNSAKDREHSVACAIADSNKFKALGKELNRVRAIKEKINNLPEPYTVGAFFHIENAIIGIVLMIISSICLLGVLYTYHNNDKSDMDILRLRLSHNEKINIRQHYEKMKLVVSKALF